MTQNIEIYEITVYRDGRAAVTFDLTDDGTLGRLLEARIERGGLEMQFAGDTLVLPDVGRRVLDVLMSAGGRVEVCWTDCYGLLRTAAAEVLVPAAVE